MVSVRAACLALLLIVPAALASWSPTVASHVEPSSMYDDPSFMWFDAPTNPGGPERLYFAADLAPVPGDPAARRIVAWLGYWKDCNGDGYVGNFAAEEYASELLLDTSVCPPGLLRNQGGTVREFLWVGPGSLDVDDPAAKVWSDWGLPGASVNNGPKTAPDDVLTFDPTASGPKWRGSFIWLTSSQGDRRPGESTHYAYAPGSVTGPEIPSNGGYYADVACMPTPPAAGWDCDPGHWVGAVHLYERYHLRDIDCHDFANQPAGTC